MIRFLFWLFLSMFVYGCFTGLYGAGLLSLGMCFLVLFGERQLAKRDEEFYNDPANADSELDTLIALEEAEVESSGSRF
jgi:hypothetical protein